MEKIKDFSMKKVFIMERNNIATIEQFDTLKEAQEEINKKIKEEEDYIKRDTQLLELLQRYEDFEHAISDAKYRINMHKKFIKLIEKNYKIYTCKNIK